MEGATPVASPNSLFYNTERELESLPQQSLIQSINVHYGERPNLKRMLFKQKESSVGVLVCGPKKMRHEVANICSSGVLKVKILNSILIRFENGNVCLSMYRKQGLNLSI
ncbi:unnamed protein product [Lactuca virosa]|uniref:Ferric reductase NAD binding domain-containing protein n=1 Tax=Lactuca virosa TaxID=75947 RepID=A0AAU9PCI7_9ASTR|nr:unnamed protein product [Lactuca virosa]